MEKLDSALCQWIVLYTNYFNFQFSYLHAFYKPNNIKPSLAKKLKLIFKFSTIKGQIISLPIPLLSCESSMFIKENPNRKKRKKKYWDKLIIIENKPESKFLNQTEIYHKNLNYEVKFLQLSFSRFDSCHSNEYWECSSVAGAL